MGCGYIRGRGFGVMGETETERRCCTCDKVIGPNQVAITRIDGFMHEGSCKRDVYASFGTMKVSRVRNPLSCLMSLIGDLDKKEGK